MTNCRNCSELGLKRFTVLDNRPTLADMENKFRRTKLIACIGSIALSLAMIPVWPLLTLADGVMDIDAFTRWVKPNSIDKQVLSMLFVKARFPCMPTQRTQRKERNEMTSSLDRPITAASDDGVCRWQAGKL